MEAQYSYLNLKTEMERNSITIEQVADALEIHRNSAANKIEGRTNFTIYRGIMYGVRLIQSTQVPQISFREPRRGCFTLRLIAKNSTYLALIISKTT